MVRRDLACRAIGVPRIQYRYPKGRGEYGRMQISAWEALVSPLFYAPILRLTPLTSEPLSRLGPH